ncbi:MAG: cation:proton antiporter [Nanoarchaeota archaeon]
MEIFIQLAIILFTAFVISYLVRLFKQPIIVGYIIAGIIVSPFILGFGASKEIIDIFSKFGIAFLLFIVGLHLNPKVIKEIGISSLLILMFISSISNGTDFSSFALKGLLGGAGLIGVLFLMGYFVLPRLTRSIAKSQELLFLFSICWCFVVSALFSYIGFSIEIGALVAGITLSISPYSTEITSKIRPLRDFFLIIFFIILGLNIQVANIGTIIVSALILSFVVLLFKPLILMTLMAIFRYTKRTNFLVGTTLAQISEFSLIILALGVSIGHVPPRILSIITLTGMITITLSTYLIMYSNKIYNKLSNFVSIFERRKINKEKKIEKEYDAILFGYNRIGFSILKSLKKLKQKYLVVDFDPDIISDLSKLRIPCLYGDAFDAELLDELKLDKIKLAISTIPDFETNVLLIDSVRRVNSKAIIIVRSHDIKEALKLYEEGASYVLTPHFLGGEYIAKMIKHLRTKREYKDEKNKHIKMLKDRIKKGHIHPDVERN